MFAEIVLAKAPPKLNKIYHYEIPEELKTILSIGHQVLVPFGSSKRVGYVIGFSQTSEVEKTKPIIQIISKYPVFTKHGLALAKWISEYYQCFFLSALKAFLPPTIKKREGQKRFSSSWGGSPSWGGSRTAPTGQDILIGQGIPTINLTLHQQKALDQILSSLDSPEGDQILLHGIAGSGKTEVYLKVVEEAIARNKEAIILVPEIGLISQIVKKFKESFGPMVALLHSGLKDKEYFEEWEKIATGKSKIVVGTRVAIFAPLKSLKVLILDEEQESTYKQEQHPKYDARRIAAYMSQNFGIVTILGSATPSIETFYKTQKGQIKLIEMPERINKKPLPSMEIIDMKNAKAQNFGSKLLSLKLREAIKKTLEKGEKVILFINRRGFFTFQTCRECGYTIQCPNCATSLIYHFKENKLVCSHCNFTTNINIICPKCQNSSLVFLGIGTQRIEEEVGEVFHDSRIIRIDKDSVSKKGSHEKLFAAFTHGNANVLVGTQMVTKGLDLASVTLVGVVSADSMLYLPDFRASEKTFQQLMQIAGRTGRHNLQGKVIIQTLNPDHYAIKYAAANNYKSFYEEEIKQRESLSYPPYTSLINIIIQGKEENKVIKTSEDLKENLENKIVSSPRLFTVKSDEIFDCQTVKVLGPTKATIEKIRGDFRWQILLKGKDITVLQ